MKFLPLFNANQSLNRFIYQVESNESAENQKTDELTLVIELSDETGKMEATYFTDLDEGNKELSERLHQKISEIMNADGGELREIYKIEIDGKNFEVKIEVTSKKIKQIEEAQKAQDEKIKELRRKVEKVQRSNEKTAEAIINDSMEDVRNYTTTEEMRENWKKEGRHLSQAMIDIKDRHEKTAILDPFWEDMKSLQKFTSNKNSNFGKLLLEEFQEQLDAIPDEDYDFPVPKKEIIDFLKTPPSENSDN